MHLDAGTSWPRSWLARGWGNHQLQKGLRAPVEAAAIRSIDNLHLRHSPRGILRLNQRLGQRQHRAFFFTTRSEAGGPVQQLTRTMWAPGDLLPGLAGGSGQHHRDAGSISAAPQAATWRQGYIQVLGIRGRQAQQRLQQQALIRIRDDGLGMAQSQLATRRLAPAATPASARSGGRQAPIA